ncbi:MAG: hypothetical protein ACFFC6_14385, partial [Promethearchaeota archaeon]
YQHSSAYPLVENYIDPFPNWFVQGFSLWYQDGENALGPPDDEVALIYQDYGNGYLTVDFGQNLEIIDDTGPDFTIYTTGGHYIVRIGNNLSHYFEIVKNDTGGIVFQGNHSFDLAGTSHDTVRYVQVEISSDVSVELDAIEALNYNQPTPETTSPQILSFSEEDLWVWSNQSSVRLSWEVADLHPWNYSILVDDELVDQGFWANDSMIEYTLSLTDKSEVVGITLILHDLFRNSNESLYEIEIRSPPSNTSSSSESTSEPTEFPYFPFLVGLACVSVLKLRKMKGKKAFP